MAREIFISYSRKDLDKVKAIKEEVEKDTGAECWMDLEGIESGSTQFTHDIVDGINDCRVFLFMLSHDSQLSKYALRELNFAMKKAETDKHKHVVIVNIDNCQMRDDFDFLYGLTDTIAWNNYPQQDKLLKDLKKWLGVKNGKLIVPSAPIKKQPTATIDERTELIFNVKGIVFKMIRVEGLGMPYYIGETQVTQGLWQAIMNTNPSNYQFKGLNMPVVEVSWDDCCSFIGKLNTLTGKNFRLPNESEWEYAAKGGNKDNGYMYAGSDDLDEVGWYYDNSQGKYGTSAVKMKKPNDLRIYDMSGNVQEWCDDTYNNSDELRVVKGGSWFSQANRCRITYRDTLLRTFRENYVGFRLAL